MFRTRNHLGVGDLDFADIRRTPVDPVGKREVGACGRDLGDTTLKIEWRYLSRTTRDELGRDDGGLHR